MLERLFLHCYEEQLSKDSFWLFRISSFLRDLPNHVLQSVRKRIGTLRCFTNEQETKERIESIYKNGGGIAIYLPGLNGSLI
jgi:hypothetical protein